MAALFRIVSSIVVGVAIAFVLVIAVELASAVIHPLPPDFDGSMVEMCNHVKNYPHWVLALVVVAWGLTTSISTWVTRRIGNRGSALFVGVFLFAAVAFNVAMLPYPLWFKIVMLLAIPAAIYLGLNRSARQHKGRRASRLVQKVDLL